MQAFEVMDVHAGESVFISGGTGSLGAMAIPVAKSLGLHVYTNGSGENEERVRKLGAEKFIDYRKENYADVLSGVDHVLDTLGDRELPNEFKVLNEDGSQLDRIGRLFDKEHPLETSIDTVFTLEEINEALAKVKQGKSKGKTIITVREQ